MRILICEIRTVCYNSYSYFADALGSMFEKNGHEVIYFKTSEEPLDNMERFVGETFDGIIDFNSDLPRAFLDDDSYLLDRINGPFFDVILDHPLYHHDSLKNKLKNFHVFCLDEYHKTYIEQYYPHIKSVNVISLTGEKSSLLDDVDCFEHFHERPYDVIFTGSYTDPGKIELAISKIPDFLQDNVHDLIDIMLADPKRTIESAVAQLCEDAFNDYIKTDVALHTQSFYLADAYVRCINRHNIIKELDKQPLNMHVFGGCWNELDLRNITIHQEVAFFMSFVSLSHAKIALNVMPNFKNGCHDRIFTSQLNGAASCTDPSESLLKEYKDNENIIFYQLNETEKLPEILKEQLSNPERLIKIAQMGQKIALKNHTWANIYEVFNNVISNNN